MKENILDIELMKSDFDHSEGPISVSQYELEFVFYVKTDVSPLSTCMSKICKQEL